MAEIVSPLRFIAREHALRLRREASKGQSVTPEDFADEVSDVWEEMTANLAQALREVLSNHGCGQITCASAASTLHAYEFAVGVPKTVIKMPAED